MNDRNLALKISKHPLLRKLTEDKTIPNSVIARLIVEEISNASNNLLLETEMIDEFNAKIDNAIKDNNEGALKGLYAYLSQVVNNPEVKKKPDVLAKIEPMFKKVKDALGIEEKEEDNTEEKIKTAIDNAKSTEELEKINKQVQDSQVSDETKQKTKKAAEEKAKELKGKAAVSRQELDIKPIAEKFGEYEYFKPLNDEQKKVMFKFIALLKRNKLFEGLTDKTSLVKTLRDLGVKGIPKMEVILQYMTEKEQQAVQGILSNTDTGVDKFLAMLKKAETEPAEKTDENPYSKLEGYKELNLKPEEETVFISFLDKLKESNIIKEANLTTLGQMIGTKRGLNQILKSFQGDDKKILFRLLRRDDVQAFIQKNLVSISKPKEEPGSSDPGEQLPIEQENVKPFLDSADNFLKEFYRQKYKIKQAGFIKAVLDALGGMVEDENLAQAAQRVPDKKPKEEPQSDEAATEEKPEETKPPEQAQQDLKEQEEKKQASKDEMRNLRIGMNSLIKRINWSRKALDKFQETAGKGSVLADADKKNFIKVLEEIQMSIKRICLVLQQILKDSEKLNEQEESEVIKQWKEIQKKYNLASEAISNLAELLKPGGVSEIPKMLTNDAYSALIDLAGHFPSVAPFGQGKENRKDFQEYDVKFNNAITKVKDDLQNVFSLMKTGQAGEESLILALDGLKEFSAQIQAIFGVASKFEELKIEPNEEAAEGEPEDMGDFPRDLPTQIKDTLDEYYGTYKRVKKILAKGLFKESINDDYQTLKGALASSKKSIKAIASDYKDLVAAGEKDGISRKETASMVGDMYRYFVAVYEELMKLYKKATGEPEEAKKQSWWENLWPQITAQFDKLKDTLKDLYDKFEDWLVGKGLDIDLDLQPGDIPGTEAPEVEVEEDFTEEISEAENSFKQFFSQEKFQELGGDPKYYNVFMKMVLIIYSKSAINEVNIGSINAPLTRSAPTGMFDQTVLQNKLKKLAQTNESLVREISEMLAAISTDKMKPLLEFVAQNKNNIVSLDFDAILSNDFAIAKKPSDAKKPQEKGGIKTPSNLITLLRSKTTPKTRMLTFVNKNFPKEANRIQSSLIIWYMMIKQELQQPIKEEKKSDKFSKMLQRAKKQASKSSKNIFNKIPPKVRKQKKLERDKIIAIQRKLRLHAPEIAEDIAMAHNQIKLSELTRIYGFLDQIFEEAKILIPLNNKATIEKFKVGLMSDQKKQDDEEQVDDSLLDTDDELVEQISRKIKPLIREMLNKGK